MCYSNTCGKDTWWQQDILTFKLTLCLKWRCNETVNLTRNLIIKNDPKHPFLHYNLSKKVVIHIGHRMGQANRSRQCWSTEILVQLYNWILMPLWKLSIARQHFVSAVASLMIANVSRNLAETKLTNHLFQNEIICLNRWLWQQSGAFNCSSRVR